MAGHTGGAGATGGCPCGAVRYATTASPDRASLCHCRMCQKAGGAPFMAFFSVPAASLTWTVGQPAAFASSSVATRGFCLDCGTPLTYQREPRSISITTGSLDDPSRAVPTERLGQESVLAWSEQVGALPIRSVAAWMESIGSPAIVNQQYPDHDS